MSEQLHSLTEPGSPDVPIIVDSVKRHPDFQMTRCNYLSVECDSPHPDWLLSIGGERFPFLMLGLMGVVQQPFGAPLFSNADQIDDLFRRIEDEGKLLVDIEDIWLPNFLFEGISPTPSAGMVYRVTNLLFTLALLYREGSQESEAFEVSCRELREGLRFSTEETEAFEKWGGKQIVSAIEQYPKDKNYALSWEEEKGKNF